MPCPDDTAQSDPAYNKLRIMEDRSSSKQFAKKWTDKHNVNVKRSHLIVDVWTHILSHLGPADLCRMAAVCSEMQECLRRTRCRLQFSHPRYRTWVLWEEVAGSMMKYMPQTRGITLSEASCTDAFVRTAAAWVRGAGRAIDFSISKCFSVSSSVFDMLPLCTNIAVCDVTLDPQGAENNVPHPSMRSLILSNCSSLHHGLFDILMHNLPPGTRLLAMGGSQKLLTHIDGPAAPALDSRDLVVECTFWNGDGKKHLRELFPSAVFMDLMLDDVVHLERCVGVITRDGPFPFFAELLSCASSGTRQTPLHLSCMQADSVRCEWLIQHGARIMALDVRGCTPLHRAADACIHSGARLAGSTLSDNRGVLACVRALLDAGANIFAKNQASESPMFIACLKGDVNSLDAMLKKVRSAEGVTSVELPTSVQDFEDYKKYTVLHAAVIGRNIKCCKSLLGVCEHDGDISTDTQRDEGNSLVAFLNRENSFGYTALDLARRYSDSEETIQLFVKYGAVSKQKDRQRSGRRERGKRRHHGCQGTSAGGTTVGAT